MDNQEKFEKIMAYVNKDYATKAYINGLKMDYLQAIQEAGKEAGIVMRFDDIKKAEAQYHTEHHE